MNDKIIHATDATIDGLIKQAGTVLVDFWAPWCGPCKMISKSLDAVSETTAATIVKIDIDENPEATTKFGIRGIPTLKIYKNGELITTKVGNISTSAINDLLS